MGAQFSMLCAEDWRQADALAPAERTGQLMKDALLPILFARLRGLADGSAAAGHADAVQVERARSGDLRRL